jgi:hypothetical protein
MELDVFFIKIPVLHLISAAIAFHTMIFPLHFSRHVWRDVPFIRYQKWLAALWRDVPFSSPEMAGCTFVDHFFPLILQF